jgi:hypothetical protein
VAGHPIPECSKIENLARFFNGRIDALYVDGSGSPCGRPEPPGRPPELGGAPIVIGRQQVQVGAGASV